MAFDHTFPTGKDLFIIDNMDTGNQPNREHRLDEATTPPLWAVGPSFAGNLREVGWLDRHTRCYINIDTMIRERHSGKLLR